MPIYQIERISRDTGMAKKELESAPFLSIAFLQQEMKHGKDYIYRLVGSLESGKIVSDEPDHNTVNKDQLHRFHQYIKSNSESSHPKPPTSNLTLHNLAYIRYMIKEKGKDSDQNIKTREKL